MNTKMKRFFGILLSLALVMGLMPGMMTAQATSGTNYPVWVAGMQVTSENATSADHPTWSYDVSTKTLKLSDYYYLGSISTDTSTYHGVIETAEDIKIVLFGTNTITENGVGCGILAKDNSNLTISGDGTLTIEAPRDGIKTEKGKVEINGGTLNVKGGHGICGYGGVTITGGKVTATGSYGYNGIYGHDGVTISGGTVTAVGGENGKGISSVYDVVISGGTVEATSDGENGLGISAKGITVGDKITSFTAVGEKVAFSVSGTVKNAIAGTGWTDIGGNLGETSIEVSTTGYSMSDLSSFRKVNFPTIVAYDLWVGGKQVTSENAANVTGGTTATVIYDEESNTLTLDGANLSGDDIGATEDEFYYYGTIRTTLSKLTINVKSDSTVTAVSGKGASYGIYAPGCMLTINGNGKLTAKGGNNCGYNGGILAGNIIVNGKVNAIGVEPGGQFSGTYDQGIYTSYVLTINKGAEVTASGAGANGVALYEGNNAKLKNAIAGTGWTDTAGTEGETSIKVSTDGQSLKDLSSFKKVQFPAEADPDPDPDPDPDTDPDLDPEPDPDPVPETKPDPEPTDRVTAFVTRCYIEILGRNPDQGGLDYWVKLLKSKETSAAECVYGFLTSAEFAGRECPDWQVIEILYRTMMNRAVESSGLEYWLKKIWNGADYADLVNGFAASTECRSYCTWCGIIPGSVRGSDGTKPDALPAVDVPAIEAFLTRCYRLMLGRNPDAVGLKYWTDAMANGTSAAEVVYGFMTSNEQTGKQLSARQTVQILYQTMLDRQPEEKGMAYWLGCFDRGDNLAAIVNGFCESTEFRNICAKYGMKPGKVAGARKGSDTEPAETWDGEKVRAFIARIYKAALGREASESEADYWTAKILNGKVSPKQAVKEIMTSTEFAARALKGEELIKTAYRVYMNREADATGLSYWTGKLNEGTSVAEMLDGFAASAEFATVVAGLK